MRKSQSHWAEQTETDASQSEALSVPNMIDMLSRIAACLRHDGCLDDLSAPVSSICKELQERRQVAIDVANEHDAERCQLKH